MKRVKIWGMVFGGFLLVLSGCGDVSDGQSGQEFSEAEDFGVEVSYATAVNTKITSSPLNPSNSSDATFKFKCNKKSCAYKCQLDGGSWLSCKSPKTYPGLADGAHNFKVKAKDKATGKWDKTPASYSWTIDATAPETSISSNPPNPSNSTDATFEFTCDDGAGIDNCTFECKLDSGGWSSCSSPQNYNGLSGGDHTFQVRARDQLGNTDSSPASYNWHIGDFWLPTSTGANAPSARFNATAVWTGTEMIVWGGKSGSMTYENSGGRYNPATDSWTPTSTGANVPGGRYQHTASWTGTEMVVWGGANATSFLNTGGRYNPSTDSWLPTSTGANVPLARNSHAQVWTGTEIIIWGGWLGPGFANDGGRYDPVEDSWTPTSIGANVPDGREDHTWVWTGTEMIIWGGQNAGGYLNTGGRYSPSSDSWVATSTTNAPVARIYHSAVWTGTKMIIWGGYYWDTSAHYLDSGGVYDPSNDSWTPTTTSNVPTARMGHTAVWDTVNSQMIIWGGIMNDGATTYYLNTGGRYVPSTDSWTPTSIGLNIPTGRYVHTAVWAGDQMIIWGGMCPTPGNSGGRYCP